MERTVPDLLRELAVLGVTLAPEGEMIAVTGNPPSLLAEEIRRQKPDVLHHLRRARALELAVILDGPGLYEVRMAHWPEYQQLVDLITDHDGGAS